MVRDQFVCSWSWHNKTIAELDMHILRQHQLRATTALRTRQAYGRIPPNTYHIERPGALETRIACILDVLAFLLLGLEVALRVGLAHSLCHFFAVEAYAGMVLRCDAFQYVSGRSMHSYSYRMENTVLERPSSLCSRTACPCIMP